MGWSGVLTPGPSPSLAERGGEGEKKRKCKEFCCFLPLPAEDGQRAGG
jgi:hypothetical protein